MAKTSIAWTDYSWPVINGCKHKSAGCKNCFAERLASTRLRHTNRYKGLATYTENGPKWTGESRLDRAELAKPLSWKSPRRVFVCEMGDLFYEGNSFEQIAAVYGVMAACPRHTFQVLTKRPKRMLGWFEWYQGSGGAGADAYAAVMQAVATVSGSAESSREWFELGKRTPWPLPNVHLGVSVENQYAANERIPLLLQCPAAVYWVSLEPLLGDIDISRYLTRGTLCECDPNESPQFRCNSRNTPRSRRMLRCNAAMRRLSWVVAGGESGPNARPMHPDWARSLLDQCKAAGVPYFFKQFGEWLPDDQRTERVSSKTWALVHENGASRSVIENGVRVGSPIWQRGEMGVWRCGKKRAGNLLDGVLYEMRPGDKW